MIVRLHAKAYSRLSRIAGELQQRLARRVSLSDALDYLLSRHDGKARGFWSDIRGKRESGKLGRGPRRSPRKVPTRAKPEAGHRREIS